MFAFCMKKPKVLENVYVEEKCEINWLKESENSMHKILLKTTNYIFSI